MNKLKINKLHLNGAAVVESIPFEDSRGSFNRFFCSAELEGLLAGREISAVNCSITCEVGVVRGLHFQNYPYAEIKMIRCLYGKVFDVMVDLRQDSPTYLQWHAEVLTPENMKMMFIPEGFAHGFQVLKEDSELLYIHTASYSKEHEAGIRYDDSAISIKWPLNPIGMSKRDLEFPVIKND